MDKASIIRDAIEYIKSLQDEEKRIQSEISELESNGSAISDLDQEATTFCSKPKRTRKEHFCDSGGSRLAMPSPIEVLQVGFLVTTYILLIPHYVQASK